MICLSSCPISFQILPELLRNRWSDETRCSMLFSSQVADFCTILLSCILSGGEPVAPATTKPPETGNLSCYIAHFPASELFVSCGCCNKYHKFGGPKQQTLSPSSGSQKFEISSTSSKSRCGQGHPPSRGSENQFLVLLASGGCWPSLAGGHKNPIPASRGHIIFSTSEV